MTIFLRDGKTRGRGAASKAQVDTISKGEGAGQLSLSSFDLLAELLAYILRTFGLTSSYFLTLLLLRSGFTAGGSQQPSWHVQIRVVFSWTLQLQKPCLCIISWRATLAAKQHTNDIPMTLPG